MFWPSCGKVTANGCLSEMLVVSDGARCSCMFSFPPTNQSASSSAIFKLADQSEGGNWPCVFELTNQKVATGLCHWLTWQKVITRLVIAFTNQRVTTGPVSLNWPIGKHYFGCTVADVCFTVHWPINIKCMIFKLLWLFSNQLTNTHLALCDHQFSRPIRKHNSRDLK